MSSDGSPSWRAPVLGRRSLSGAAGGLRGAGGGRTIGIGAGCLSQRARDSLSRVARAPLVCPLTIALGSCPESLWTSRRLLALTPLSFLDWMTCAKLDCPFILIDELKERSIIQSLGDNLDPHRQPAAIEAARNAHRR